MAADALLERLVGFPSVAGRPNLDLVAWAAEQLEASGATVRVLPGAREDAANLHAVIGPADEPGVLLSAHTDVVDVEGQDWSGDPFALRREDGRLVGRGTTDMKGFVAAALAVFPYAARLDLRRPLHLALSSDEEIGCRGVPPLLDALERLPARPEWCLVGEPTGMGVGVSHKGKAALRVHVRGHAAHSSRPDEGVNAVVEAARLIVAATDFPRPEGVTVSVGPIRGGMALNTVPDACTFEIEARAPSGVDPGALLAKALGDVTTEPLASYPGLAAADDRGPAGLVARVAGGERDLALDFGTEAGLYSERLGVPVIVCGPGDMAQAHRPDEYLTVEQLERAEAFLRRLVDTLVS